MSDGKGNNNLIIHEWTKTQNEKLRSAIRSMNIEATGRFMKEFRHGYKYLYGDIERISWKMPRYAIMVDKGLGKGVGMNNGNRFDHSKSGRAMFNRKPKLWFTDSVTQEDVSVLASMLAKEQADAYVKTIGIKNENIK